MSSSTSDDPAERAGAQTADEDRGTPSATDRLVAVTRLVHPFPSLLDGLVVLVVAIIAGGSGTTALLLGGSMTLLQFAIGAANDLVDAPRDAGLKPGKPIPSGRLDVRFAGAIAIGSAAGGLMTGIAVSPAIGLLALLVLAIGLGYDLVFKGTALSWLPFAIGIPILPVYGWLGATGSLAMVFVVVVPVAFIEGAALALANALVDVERDEAAGIASVATAVGRQAGGRLAVALQLGVAVVAVVTAVSWDHGAPAISAVAGSGLVLVLGAEASRRASMRGVPEGPVGRERAWCIQAVGAGLLAVTWLAGALATGRF